MQQPGITSEYTEPVTVLCVSPIEDDHSRLQAIISHSKWRLFKAESQPTALSILRRERISVVVCEHDLKSGKWTDLLDRMKDLKHPPSMIVTSCLADERLWAEALNLGAWDVLAKPFDRTEVLRTVKTAWQHWHDCLPVRAVEVMSAAS